MHSVTDKRHYGDNCGSYCMQYDRLKSYNDLNYDSWLYKYAYRPIKSEWRSGDAVKPKHRAVFFAITLLSCYCCSSSRNK